MVIECPLRTQMEDGFRFESPRFSWADLRFCYLAQSSRMGFSEQAAA